MTAHHYGCIDCDNRWSAPALVRGGFVRCPACREWRGVSLSPVEFDAYPDATPSDPWLRAELLAALHDLRDDASPIEVLRGLTAGARRWMVTHLSRRGWDVVGGIPMRRPGEGIEQAREREAARKAVRKVPPAGGSDEQFARTSGNGPMRVNGWGRRW